MTKQYDNKENTEVLARLLTLIFGADSGCWDDSPEDTAKRVLRFWGDFVPKDEMPFTFTTFPSEADQQIVVTNIEFSSVCAHHLLPFYGVAHVGYIPHELQVGLSKVPRLVDWYAKRPQTQEALTKEIASFMKKKLAAKGVAVIVRARHTCMSCRGVMKHNGQMVTSEMRGVYLTAPAARSEFMGMVDVGGGL